MTQEKITATFQGAFIESGKFEYTDAGNHLLHRNISEDLTCDAIAELNRRYSGVECRLQIIRGWCSIAMGIRRRMWSSQE